MKEGGVSGLGGRSRVKRAGREQMEVGEGVHGKGEELLRTGRSHCKERGKRGCVSTLSMRV